MAATCDVIYIIMVVMETINPIPLRGGGGGAFDAHANFDKLAIALRTDDVTVMSEYYLSEFIIYSCLFLHFQQKKIVH